MTYECSPDDAIWQTVAEADQKQRYTVSGTAEPQPSAIILIEHYDALWQAILAKSDELLKQYPPGRGNSTGAAWVDHYGREVSRVVKICTDDGADLVFSIVARSWSTGNRIEVAVDGPWIDNHDAFWAKEHADRSNAVVIGHEHYRIEPDQARDTPGYCLGYGGQRFRIRRLVGGEVIETRNLWHQGVIPPSWRDRLPNDAEFIKGASA